MKVLLSTTAYPGQDFHRITEPARAVNEADLGVEAVVRHGLETRVVEAPGTGEQSIGWVETNGADVVVMQLPGTVALLECMRWLQAQGVAVVVEIDDLVSAVSTSSAAYDIQIKGGLARRMMNIAREADLVTVTTPALIKEFAAHGRGMIVPNAVPRRIAELPPAYEREPGTATIGWTGSVLSRPHDLRVVGSGLQQALDRTVGRSRFMVLGEVAGAVQALGLGEEPAETPWIEDVETYARVVGEVFDIGIAPLRDDRFNSAKSGLKVLEYAARGVYAVHSPHTEYDRLRMGRRSRNARDWARNLTAAVEDPDMRREVAAAQRERVLAGHLTEHTAELWVTAWRKALDNRRQALRIGA